MEKENKWSYAISEEVLEKTKTISVSRDGVMAHLKAEGYRECMCGVLSFYDESGERLESIYIAKSPEYGKKRFNEIMDKEIEEIKKKIPNGKYVGIADGAKDNWSYLNAHTEEQILDYFHATEYLYGFSEGYFEDKKMGEVWYEKAKTILKDDQFGCVDIKTEMIEMVKKMEAGTDKKKCEKSIVYFGNNEKMMKYWDYQKKGYPIGSGVTEAACKTVVKHRCCRSGMRWSTKGLNGVLALRQLVLTPHRWEGFWNKIDRYGFDVH